MTEYAPTDLVELEQVQAEKDLQARLAQENEEADWAWLMSSRQGRRIVWRLLERAGFFTSTFSTNALLMARDAGRRDFAGMLLEFIHRRCPELYPTMVKEQKRKHGRDADGRNETNS